MTDHDINELKQIVLKTLEAKDALGKIKAQLRASVYTAIEEQERASGIYLENPTARKLLDSGEGKIVVDLLREFFEFCGLDSTNSVFLPEANLPQSYSGRTGLSRQLNLNNAPSDKPLLFEVINQYNQKKGVTAPASSPATTPSSALPTSLSSSSTSSASSLSLSGAPSLLGPREREKQEAARKQREEEERVRKEKEENEKREKERKEKERIEAENAKKKQQEQQASLTSTKSSSSLSSLSDLPTPPFKRSAAPVLDDFEEKPKSSATKAPLAPTKSAASPEPIKKSLEPPSKAAAAPTTTTPSKGGLVFLDDDDEEDDDLLGGKKKPQAAAAAKKSTLSLSDDEDDVEEQYDEDFVSDDDLSDVTDDRSGEGLSVSGYDLIQNAERP